MYIEIMEYMKGDIKEFFLNGLEFVEDFDVVLDVLTTYFEVQVIDKIDGIWFWQATLLRDGKGIKLVYHDDVGTYLFMEKQSTENNEYLYKMLEEAIPYIAERISPDAKKAIKQ